MREVLRPCSNHSINFDSFFHVPRYWCRYHCIHSVNPVTRTNIFVLCSLHEFSIVESLNESFVILENGIKSNSSVNRTKQEKKYSRTKGTQTHTHTLVVFFATSFINQEKTKILYKISHKIYAQCCTLWRKKKFKLLLHKKK